MFRRESLKTFLQKYSSNDTSPNNVLYGPFWSTTLPHVFPCMFPVFFLQFLRSVDTCFITFSNISGHRFVSLITYPQGYYHYAYHQNACAYRMKKPVRGMLFRTIRRAHDVGKCHQRLFREMFRNIHLKKNSRDSPWDLPLGADIRQGFSDKPGGMFQFQKGSLRHMLLGFLLLRFTLGDWYQTRTFR